MKFTKIIEEGISYNEETIGLDANLFYKHLLSDRNELRELRSYVHLITEKLVKIINHLNRKSPQLKQELLLLLVEEIGNTMRKIIQQQHRSLDYRELRQIWAEVDCYQRFAIKYKSESIERCFKNLKKIFSKQKGLKKVASEADIFSKDQLAKKEILLARELDKTKLMQGCLG